MIHGIKRGRFLVRQFVAKEAGARKEFDNTPWGQFSSLDPQNAVNIFRIDGPAADGRLAIEQVFGAEGVADVSFKNQDLHDGSVLSDEGCQIGQARGDPHLEDGANQNLLYQRASVDARGALLTQMPRERCSFPGHSGQGFRAFSTSSRVWFMISSENVKGRLPTLRPSR